LSYVLFNPHRRGLGGKRGLHVESALFTRRPGSKDECQVGHQIRTTRDAVHRDGWIELATSAAPIRAVSGTRSRPSCPLSSPAGACTHRCRERAQHHHGCGAGETRVGPQDDDQAQPGTKGESGSAARGFAHVEQSSPGDGRTRPRCHGCYAQHSAVDEMLTPDLTVAEAPGQPPLSPGPVWPGPTPGRPRRSSPARIRATAPRCAARKGRIKIQGGGVKNA